MTNNILSQQIFQITKQSMTRSCIYGNPADPQFNKNKFLSLKNKEIQQNELKYLFNLPAENKSITQLKYEQIIERQDDLIKLLRRQIQKIKQKMKLKNEQKKQIAQIISNICKQNNFEHKNDLQGVRLINQFLKKILKQITIVKFQADKKIKDIEFKFQDQIRKYKKNLEEQFKSKQIKKTQKKYNSRYRQKTLDDHDYLKQIQELKQQIKKLKAIPAQKSQPIFIQSIRQKKVQVIIEKIVQQKVYIQKIVQKPIIREKIIEVEKIVQVDNVKQVIVEKEKIIQVPIEVLKIVEKSVYIDKIVEKIIEKPIFIQKRVEIQKKIEKPIYVQRKVRVEIPIYIEKKVEVEKIVQKPIYIDRQIEKIVYIDNNQNKKIEQYKTIYIDRIIEVQKPIFVQKIKQKIVYVKADGKQLKRLSNNFKYQ